MRPTVSEQLAGISAILTRLATDQLSDDYTGKVLLEAANSLTTLSRTWHAIPDFLRWDSAQAATILDLIGQPSPPAPHDCFDIPAMESHHRDIRKRLERSILMIAGNPTGRLAVVAYFRDRVKRFGSLASSTN